MEENESLKPVVNESPVDLGIVAPSLGSRGEIIPSQQSQAGSCPTCGRLEASAPPPYIYAIGQLKAVFANRSLEKEFAQASGRAETKGLTDRQVLYEVLKQNRYLARSLCYVLTIKGLETYIVLPKYETDYGDLMDAIGGEPNPTHLTLVIGERGPIPRPEMCNGLMIPTVFFDGLYFFDRASLLAAIPRPEKVSEKQFKASTEQLFDHILQMTDNAGATDEYRALNYLAVRSPRIYEVTYNAFQQNKALSEVKVIPSSLSGSQKIVKVTFLFTQRETGVVEKYCTEVAVEGRYPYLVTQLSLCFDH